PILYTWFDRPLSVAGRVMLRGDDVLSPKTQLIKINRPILVIPHLAIHFNRSVNEGNPLSKQKDMLPILGIIKDEISRENILLKLIAKELDVDIKDIIDFDLLIYDTTKSTRVGLDEEFISAGRIDDLSMVHAGLTALLDSNDSKTTRVLAIFDNEETGSGTKQGAASPVLKNILKRLIIATGGNDEDFYRAIAQSFMLSADNAHAFHPNYPEKYDITNHPVMGGGPVIKINANCKYMTDAHSSAIFKEICRKANVPMQYFVNHSDVAGGSTLGNILTSQIDIAGVDIGNPIWAMHSVRETGSVDDHCYMICALKQFFSK
ncbi:MAG: M18 family aminopeptidase, partial [Muribaculaceae bacterium]